MNIDTPSEQATGEANQYETPDESRVLPIEVTIGRDADTCIPVICLKHDGQEQNLKHNAAVSYAEQVLAATLGMTEDESTAVPFLNKNVSLSQYEAGELALNVAMFAGHVALCAQLGMFMIDKSSLTAEEAISFMWSVVQYESKGGSEPTQETQATTKRDHEPKKAVRIWVDSDPGCL